MIPRVNLVTYDDAVVPLPGMFYSTDPHSAEGDDGISYIVKDTDIEVVFAEIVGLSFAREAGINVPDAAACVGDGMYAGSARISGLRNVDAWLTQPLKVVNYSSLYDVIVVDTWLVNWDRNIGSVLGTPIGGENISLVFIDFEKSVTLRPNPLTQAPTVEPRLLWPSTLLGTILREQKPPRPPQPIIDRIRRISRERCTEIINDAVNSIGLPIDWAENSVQALMHRANNLQAFTEEVWAT
jgi:hypothetical protein